MTKKIDERKRGVFKVGHFGEYIYKLVSTKYMVLSNVILSSKVYMVYAPGSYLAIEPIMVLDLTII